ncbi:hypothetical protein [Salmonella enterica]|uniref:hypothetical protein n=1 Tax=Salmonella enterica TaxID=28901 RepID=UPI0003BB6AE1|nr:hypothetical protein [Salmonella enterica]ESC08265.1 hypothetical protein SEEK0253_14205 [Salmonella enterica subsp. enterica serovar Kentucky str. 0253]
MNSPHYFSAKALNDEIIARLLKDEDRLVISKSFSGDKHCGWHITAPRYLWIKAGVHPVWIRESKGNKLQSKVGTKRMERARQLLSLSLQETNPSLSPNHFQHKFFIQICAHKEKIQCLRQNQRLMRKLPLARFHCLQASVFSQWLQINFLVKLQLHRVISHICNIQVMEYWLHDEKQTQKDG